MIIWCAYCQTYQGESAPFDDYGLSHGICPRCDAAEAWADRSAPARALPLREFWDQLREVTLAGNLPAARTTLQRGIALGVRPLDLAFGMMQPLLREVGVLWQRGEFDVAREHAASQMVRELINLEYELVPECGRLRNAPHPTVLLCAPEDNTHLIGLEFVELWLATHGISSMRPRHPAHAAEIADAVAAARPRWVGLSVALPGQLASVQAIVAAIEARGLANAPRFAVGGALYRSGDAAAALPGVVSIVSVAAFLDLLG